MLFASSSRDPACSGLLSAARIIHIWPWTTSSENSVTALVHAAEFELGVGMFLLGRPAKPFHRLDVVLRDFVTQLVRDAERELGIGMPLLGHLAKPSHRLDVVLWTP